MASVEIEDEDGTVFAGTSTGLRDSVRWSKRSKPGSPSAFHFVVDRHFYELCALAELRDRLRAGDIRVTGSRQYRDFETYLIPTATFKLMQKEPLPLDVDTHLPSYLAECRQRLEDNLATVARKARRRPSVQMNFGRSAPMYMTSPQPLSVL